jgi:hypothetical protein
MPYLDLNRDAAGQAAELSRRLRQALTGAVKKKGKRKK